MGFIPIGLAGLVFISLLQAAWARRKAFELRMQILEVAELAVRRGRSMVPGFRKLAMEQSRFGRRALTKLARDLESGEELSEALHWAAPESFPPRVIAVIREVDGTAELAAVLASLVEQTDASFAVQHRLSVALLYPVGLALGVLFAQEAVIHAYAGGYAGIIEAGWFSVSDVFSGLPRGVDPWLVFSVGVLSIILIAHCIWRSRPLLRRISMQMAARIPWMSTSGRYLAASQFLMTLSHLVGAGQALPAAMRRALGAAGSLCLEKGVQASATALEAGQSANDAWRLTGLPEFAVASVTAATHSAQIDFAHTLRRTAVACRERFVARRERMLDLMHPVGVLVFGILLAVNFGMMISITGYVGAAQQLW